MHWGLLGFKNAVEATAEYDFGDKRINYFNYGYDALINMGFAAHLHFSSNDLFEQYSNALNNAPMNKFGVLNYIGSHDDNDSFDRARNQTYDSAFKLMMAPGGVQIYYGDEIARPMLVNATSGDASMREVMNWNDLASPDTQALLVHWQKLGQFRQAFRAIGAGEHHTVKTQPFIFSRALAGHPSVIVGEGLPLGVKHVAVDNVFMEGEWVTDHYSGQSAQVIAGSVTFNTDYTYVLLAKQT